MINETKFEVIIPDDKGLVSGTGIVKKIESKKYMDREAIVDVLNRMSAGRDKMVCTTLWMTGVRVTELINIRLRDIDFGKRIVRIRWLKSRKWTERLIPVKIELINLLQLYCANQKIHVDQQVFPYTRQRIYQITKKWFLTNPHTFRHSFAVNFIEQTKSPKSIIILKEYLGHSRIETTMEYLKIVPFDMAIELEKIQFN